MNLYQDVVNVDDLISSIATSSIVGVIGVEVVFMIPSTFAKFIGMIRTIPYIGTDYSNVIYNHYYLQSMSFIVTKCGSDLILAAAIASGFLSACLT